MIRGDPDLSPLVVYPEVRSKTQLGDLLNRLGWYLPKRQINDCQIFVPTSISDPLAAPTPHYQARYPIDHLPIHFADPENSTRPSNGTWLVWDAQARLSVQGIRHIDQIEIVDSAYYSEWEPATWSRISHELRRDAETSSEEEYQRLERKARDYESAFVFATGPNLDRAWDFEFPENTLKIICNSIVRNDELLDHIDPDVLVFADPVFHFGPSKYADTFRRDAIETLRKYDCVGVIPPRYRSLLLGHYPNLNVISLKSEEMDDPRFPSHDDLLVMNTSNIMTLYMLPIASSLTDEVYIVGADGRAKDESYFWEHNESAQYEDELMETAVYCHPSFFRDEIYSDYYKEHVRTLDELIRYGESRDIDYYSLTDSYIQTLAERKVPGSSFQL